MVEQILNAMGAKRDSEREAHERAGLRWTTQMEQVSIVGRLCELGDCVQKENQIAKCKEHISELRSQLSSEQVIASH